ncbi:MAG: hypothetical protein K0R17_2082 [Rariglobus sp.]|nr:hypothetical protein [Rariglobus sp.]
MRTVGLCASGFVRSGQVVLNVSSGSDRKFTFSIPHKPALSSPAGAHSADDTQAEGTCDEETRSPRRGFLGKNGFTNASSNV